MPSSNSSPISKGTNWYFVNYTIILRSRLVFFFISPPFPSLRAKRQVSYMYQVITWLCNHYQQEIINYSKIQSSYVIQCCACVRFFLGDGAGVGKGVALRCAACALCRLWRSALSGASHARCDNCPQTNTCHATDVTRTAGPPVCCINRYRAVATAGGGGPFRFGQKSKIRHFDLCAQIIKLPGTIYGSM